MTIEKKEPRERFLALDTSTATLGVAVTENNRVVHEINASGERNHSVHLLPIIEQALQASGTHGSSLAGISVGIGPGSYTGTRIAVTAAKTLAWAWNIPVVGVSSLQALAWGGFMKNSEVTVEDNHAPDWIIPLLDARRGQAYTALFASNGTARPERLAPDAIRLMQDWVPQLVQLLQQAETAGNKPRCLWFVGETSLHASDEALKPLRGITDTCAVPYELEGRWTGFLGEEQHSHGSDDIHSLIPNYTQLSEAEANLLKSTEGGSK